MEDQGGVIFLRYQRNPAQEHFEFIRDYLNFKLSRAEKAAKKG